jgi:D-alanyl-D-alanine carboxypeptidase/D-alanyl-D-alanine-endopeptidase (penicillin-binding protein 4)
MKTITLAVAADRLGWDYPFRTRVLMAGTVADGTLNGDLVIVGSGDPTIENWRGNTWLDTWPELLRGQGIRRINGRIVGDDSAFDDEGLGAGWTW